MCLLLPIEIDSGEEFRGVLRFPFLHALGSCRGTCPAPATAWHKLSRRAAAAVRAARELAAHCEAAAAPHVAPPRQALAGEAGHVWRPCSQPQPSCRRQGRRFNRLPTTTVTCARVCCRGCGGGLHGPAAAGGDPPLRAGAVRAEDARARVFCSNSTST